jgi:hypothetical protein
MAKFTYDDIVKVMESASSELRPGSKAWVVGVFEEKDRQGQYFKRFNEGVVYTIEFEDGKSTEIHEDDLVLFEE